MVKLVAMDCPNENQHCCAPFFQMINAMLTTYRRDAVDPGNLKDKETTKLSFGAKRACVKDIHSSVNNAHPSTDNELRETPTTKL